ncbi:Hypothetical predicted protein [Octopus vulgaris]|uniref:Uncharacterized protein n=2 Tax=Octopus TaxID=6643 RepID=A0AA36FAE1_OCTVU|nr:Hypothetical predicted protein [Octopus vulgaris]
MELSHQRSALCWPQKHDRLACSLWDVPPLDFSLRSNTGARMRGIPMVVRSRQKSQNATHFYTKPTTHQHFKEPNMPELMQCCPESSENNSNFVLRFKILRPNTARKLAVRFGKLPTGCYTNPKPHDHRDLPPIKDLQLPEFVTSCRQREPSTKPAADRIYSGQRFKLREPIKFDGAEGKNVNRFSTRKSPESKWDRSLCLKKDPYRFRYPAFTRHRRLDRTAHSALFDRIQMRFLEKLRS